MYKELELFKKWFGNDLTTYEYLNVNIDIKKNVLELTFDYGHSIDVTKKSHELVKLLEHKIPDVEYLLHYPHDAGNGGEDFDPYYEVVLVLSKDQQDEWEQYVKEKNHDKIQ